MGIYEIPKTELIERAAKELQKIDTIQAPPWALFVKTGMFKERQPERNDWWYVRAAAILRRLSDREGPIGVQKLRTLYGGRKNRGHAPEEFYKGSGNILRKILQQLEKAGFAKKVEKGLHKGRIITPQGLSFLGKIADAYMKENNIVLPKKPDTELAITELPKEKTAKKVRIKKKEEPTLEGEEVPVIPKKKRAPRKKKAEAPAEIPASAPVVEAPTGEQ